MIALTFYLYRGNGINEKYGAYVIQRDYWRDKDGEIWEGRNGIPPKEMGKNPTYLYTMFVTINNETLIPVYKHEK